MSRYLSARRVIYMFELHIEIVLTISMFNKPYLTLGHSVSVSNSSFVFSGGGKMNSNYN